MARCNSCNKWGLSGFTREGLCSGCNQKFHFMWDQYARILGESVHLMNTSKKADTRLSRAQLAIDKTDDMEALASQFGILVHFGAQISQQRAQLKTGTIEIISEEIESFRMEANSKSEMASTPRGMIGPYEKHVEKVEKLADFITDSSRVTMEKEWAKGKIWKLELEILKKEAEKAAFKGDTKKAIDKYKDALFNIKSDEVPDEYQKEDIQFIEQRIIELESGE